MDDETPHFDVVGVLSGLNPKVLIVAVGADVVFCLANIAPDGESSEYIHDNLKIFSLAILV